ncbi:hypothetical protein [Cryobacterium arcticum]|nr:hypothetical protein [Cryobacterium arcticum]
MTQPGGPFAVMVFGTIDAKGLRLDLSTDPARNMCALQLFDLAVKKVLGERNTAPSFEEAIAAYPWRAVLDELAFADDEADQINL